MLVSNIPLLVLQVCECNLLCTSSVGLSKYLTAIMSPSQPESNRTLQKLLLLDDSLFFRKLLECPLRVCLGNGWVPLVLSFRTMGCLCLHLTFVTHPPYFHLKACARQFCTEAHQRVLGFGFSGALLCGTLVTTASLFLWLLFFLLATVASGSDRGHIFCHLKQQFFDLRFRQYFGKMELAPYATHGLGGIAFFALCHALERALFLGYNYGQGGVGGALSPFWPLWFWGELTHEQVR